MVWLIDYVANTVLRPWITLQPVSQTVIVGDSVSFTVAGDGSGPLSYQWRKDGAPIDGNPSALTPTLELVDVTTADAGSYDCIVSNSAGSATSAAASLTVNKAAAVISLSGLRAMYDGQPHAAIVTTVPAGVIVEVTYEGSPTPPVAPGAYLVVATANDPNYFGSATGVLVITTTALVRHAPSINGQLDGSVQVLQPESMTLNGGASISGDVLVRGTPAVRLNGQPVYGGTIDGTGAASPSSHVVTINGGASLRHVVRRTDPVAFPAIAEPPAPTGRRDVHINAPGQNPGDFATIRNLTLNGNAGELVVPAGTYGVLVANGNSGFVLGVPNATEPAVYNLQGMTLNGGSRLRIVGPVILNVRLGVTVNGNVDASGNPSRLTLNISSSGLTVNGGARFSGAVIAPSGTVIVNGTLTGSVVADRLIINGAGRMNGGGS
jgi:MBG domain/Immunoglobulin I-set domain